MDDGLFSDEEIDFVETPEMIIKRQASEIFKQWVGAYGQFYSQSHGHIIGSIKQALSTGLAPRYVQEAVNRLGYEKIPITGASIQMQLSIISKNNHYSGGNNNASFDEAEYE